MAEGLLGALVAGEGEGIEAETGSEARIGAEAFAVALAADHAKYDPDVAGAAKVYLEKQARLLDVQTDELIEQRALRLSHVRGQQREGRLRRFGLRVRNAMQVFTALLFGGVGLGLCIMLMDSFASQSVVVDVFKAPTALASRGLTGDVVAASLLDGLQKLRAATRTGARGLNAQSAWSSEVKIEVPETGVSIGEVSRLLHQRFGHDLHIGGDLIQTDAGGLALTVRGDGVPAKTFTGVPSELDALTTQAAEYVYGRAQPVQYAAYLQGSGRYAEALAFAPGAFARATTDLVRARLANAEGNAELMLNRPAEAETNYRLAITLQPHYWIAWSTLIVAIDRSQGEEAAWRESQAYLQAVDKAPKWDRPDATAPPTADQLTWNYPAELASLLANASLNGGSGTSATPTAPWIADIYSLSHDPAKAERFMAASDPAEPTSKAEALLLQGRAALERGEPAAAVPPLEAYQTAWKEQMVLHIHGHESSPCLLGLAYGLAGRIADAEVVFASTGPWSACFALHGKVLAQAGDLEAAQRVWAQGLRVAPDLPMIYVHRGLWALDHGDLKAAAGDFATANSKAPRFADPLKAWGDLLAKEGRWKDALSKYDEALKYAPAWAELHSSREAAARRL